LDWTLEKYAELAGDADSLLTVLVTAVYTYVTFRIFKANQETVKAMREQLRQEQQFRIREHFLTGIAAITQYDIASAGCEQAMRLLDYYSSLALKQDDPDLFLILNTVMTGQVRKNLEDIQEKKQETYVHAVTAREHIKRMLREQNLERKGIKPKG
jgi:hypothetical protein